MTDRFFKVSDHFTAYFNTDPAFKHFTIYSVKSASNFGIWNINTSFWNPVSFIMECISYKTNRFCSCVICLIPDFFHFQVDKSVKHLTWSFFKFSHTLTSVCLHI